MESREMYCPKCGCHNLTSYKRGFNLKRFVILGLLFGIPTAGIGVLIVFAICMAGKNKIDAKCMNCGKTVRKKL